MMVRSASSPSRVLWHHVGQELVQLPPHGGGVVPVEVSGSRRQMSRHYWASLQRSGEYAAFLINAAKQRQDTYYGRAITQLRKQAGLNQRELAACSQIPLRTVRSIEHGKVDADWGTIRLIAEGMDVKLADIFRLGYDLAKGDRGITEV